MALRTASRADLERPYAVDHEASKLRKMSRGPMPKSLSGLLHWYIVAWAQEVPWQLHARGVFFGPPGERDGEPSLPKELVGGSLLGAPRVTDLFRRYVENSPSELDEDGFYVRPVHAALSRCGRSDWETAAYLYRVALANGDWLTVSASCGLPYWVAPRYTEAALQWLWRLYEDASDRAVA